MLKGSCHCGAVQLEIPRKPRRLTNCNCSICRRLGGLWAYYKETEVKVIAAPGATDEYIWGDKCLRIVRCGRCGCVTHWQSILSKAGGKMGVNARNFDPVMLGQVRIRLLDGAGSWKIVG
jgi:hypothetical protein